MPRSSSTPGPSRELAAKVRRLADTAAEAKHASFALPVTRLTALKSLCKDPEDAARFLLHLATAARDRIVHGRRPGHLTPATWQRHQTLATEAVTRLEGHLDARRGGGEEKLSDLLLRLTEEQDERKPAAWGDVRLIDNQDLLVIEEAVEGVLASEGGGRVEIGQADGHGSFVRALDDGGLLWEGKASYASLDAALTALERALKTRARRP